MDMTLKEIAELRELISAVVWALIWLCVGLWAGAGIMRSRIPAKPE